MKAASEASPDAAGEGEALRQLATLLTLQRKAQAAKSRAEIGFLLANDSQLLVPYRNAVLWLYRAKRRGRIEAMSGVPLPARDGPYGHWAAKLCRFLGHDSRATPKVVTADTAPEALRRQWREHFPAQALWLPVTGAAGRPIGALLLGRDQSWPERDIRLLTSWADAAGLALDAVVSNEALPLRLWRFLAARGAHLAAAAALVAAAGLFVPVQLTVQGAAEVIPLQALVVRAPINGVIDEIAVRPNAPVSAGALLVRFDDREIRAKLDVVRHGLELAQAEYRLAQQAAITSREAQANLNILRERIEQRRAEVVQAERLLERVELRADRDGVAVLADAEGLKGRPVRVGERILSVADPTRAELEIWIAAADSIALPDGASVDFFLNVEPGRPRPARLAYVSYQAVNSPAGILAFRATARFAEGEAPPRIGLRGTAKLHGDKVPLGYYLLRRPLAAAREIIGF